MCVEMQATAGRMSMQDEAGLEQLFIRVQEHTSARCQLIVWPWTVKTHPPDNRYLGSGKAVEPPFRYQISLPQKWFSCPEEVDNVRNVRPLHCTNTNSSTFAFRRNFKSESSSVHMPFTEKETVAKDYMVVYTAQA